MPVQRSSTHSTVITVFIYFILEALSDRQTDLWVAVPVLTLFGRLPSDFPVKADLSQRERERESEREREGEMEGGEREKEREGDRGSVKLKWDIKHVQASDGEG